MTRFLLSAEDGGCFTEGITTDDKPPFEVLELSGFGRIGLAICKDVLDGGGFLGKVIAEARIEMLFVIAYSEGEEIERNLGQWAKTLHVCVCFVNACFDGRQQCKLFLPCLSDKGVSAYEVIPFPDCKSRDCAARCNGLVLKVNI